MKKVISKTKWNSYSKKRGPPTGIGGGGGGPLQISSFIEVNHQVLIIMF